MTKKLGEPGTVAVEAEQPKGPRATYVPELATDKVPKLRINDLGVTYIDRRGNCTKAVREVTLDLLDKPGTGEVIVFLGPSGCGKSTIL